MYKMIAAPPQNYKLNNMNGKYCKHSHTFFNRTLFESFSNLEHSGFTSFQGIYTMHTSRNTLELNKTRHFTSDIAILILYDPVFYENNNFSNDTQAAFTKKIIVSVQDSKICHNVHMTD